MGRKESNQTNKTIVTWSGVLYHVEWMRSYHRIKGAQWLSGKVLDSRPNGRGFEPHRRHYVVVLEQDTYFILACTGSTQEDPSLFNWKIVDGT